MFTDGLLAHALGGVRDLPIPGIFFLYGGAAVLVLSFAALGALWGEPHLETAGRGRRLPPKLERVLLSRGLRVTLGAAGVIVYIVVLAALLLGPATDEDNFAPTVVWVILWVGLVPLCALLGNVWSVISPFRALADAAAAVVPFRMRPVPYPARLGMWPAAVLLFAIVSMELVYPEPAEPRKLAIAMVVYSGITWTGMAMFGRETWSANGEAFNVYLGFFGRMSPFAVRRVDGGRREIALRLPLSGLVELWAGPGVLAFVAVMLGSVGFDAVTRTRWWRGVELHHLTREATRIPLELAFLAGIIVFIALAYLGAVRFARAIAGRAQTPLRPLFVGCLVPIAFAYVIAHYLTLLIGQGQYAIVFASDPFRRGWNLFDTAQLVPNLKPLTTHELWYAQVGVLIVGHVLGLIVAHDRAVSLYIGAAALKSQYAMLALMVVLTAGGLYLLSSP